MFKPKLVDTLQNYSRQQFVKDLIAGIIVGIVALPLAIAFAIASGISPEKGLYTAIIAGFIISAFGGSRVQIGGPTGAFIVIVYGIVQQYGVNGLIIATFLAGIMLMLMGFATFWQCHQIHSLSAHCWFHYGDSRDHLLLADERFFWS